MDPAVLDLMLAGIPTQKDDNVLVGFDYRDDATAYRLPSGEVIVQTVDFFTPVVDDPYDYGAIAAANSLSDVYAMNGRPLFALNICAFPKTLSPDIWREVLRGGAEKALEAGIVVAGGHTIDDTEPKYGMVVTGIVKPDNIWSNNGARAGDVLLLTKPLGSGVITTALKNELLTAEEVAPAVKWMKTLNKDAAIALDGFGIKSATDITGNGFLGHAAEMAKASKVKLIIDVNKIPVMDAAWPLAEQAKVPGGTKMNKLYLGSYVSFSNVPIALEWILFDAQTSGGLLVAVPRDNLDRAMENLTNHNVFFAQIGEIMEGTGIEVRGA
jgi:selenide,water dikinase